MVEVKGFAGRCPGFVEMARNEVMTMKQPRTNGDTYTVLVVEEAQSDHPQFNFYTRPSFRIGEASGYQVHLQGSGLTGKKMIVLAMITMMTNRGYSH